MSKKIGVSLLLALNSFSVTYFNQETNEFVDEPAQIEENQALENVTYILEQKESAVPNLSTVSPEELKLFFNKLLDELTISFTSMVKKIDLILQDNENLKTEATAFKTSFLSLFQLNAQISPFNLSIDQDPWKTIENLMSLEELICKFGEEEWIDFQERTNKKFDLLDLIFVKSKTTAEFFERLIEFDLTFRDFLEQRANESNYAKLESAYPTIKPVIEQLIDWKKSLDDQSLEKLELIFKNSLKLRTDFVAWLRLINQGCVKNLHLPVLDEEIALPRIKDLLDCSKEFEIEVDRLIKKWEQ